MESGPLAMEQEAVLMVTGARDMVVRETIAFLTAAVDLVAACAKGTVNVLPTSAKTGILLDLTDGVYLD